MIHEMKSSKDDNYQSDEIRQSEANISWQLRICINKKLDENHDLKLKMLDLKKITLPHIYELAEKNGLLDQYQLLESYESADNIRGISELIEISSKASIEIVLDYWAKETNSQIKNFIIEQIALKD
jgi:hypothetical protein